MHRDHKYVFLCVCITQVNVTGNATMGIVTGLSSFTDYSCTIFATTVADGPMSEAVVVRTDEGGVLASYTIHSAMCYYAIQFLILQKSTRSLISVVAQYV